MNGSAARRLFFALWPDDGQRQMLLSVIKPLGPVQRGRAVPAGNLHVTLAFLGNVPFDRVPSLQQVARARSWPRSELVFDRLAWWPKAKLLCLETSSLPSAFGDAVEAFQEDLRFAGFELERRPFRAHITLVRNAPRPTGYDESGHAIPSFTWPVQGVALVESTPTPEGSVYRVVEGC